MEYFLKYALIYGIKKSSFRVECTKVIENDLINRIKMHLKEKIYGITRYQIYYCMMKML